MSHSEPVPALERARLYRERAADFIQKAQDSDNDEMKATYLSMAGHWRDLAVAAERNPDAETEIEHIAHIPH